MNEMKFRLTSEFLLCREKSLLSESKRFDEFVLDKTVREDDFFLQVKRRKWVKKHTQPYRAIQSYYWLDGVTSNRDPDTIGLKECDVRKLPSSYWLKEMTSEESLNPTDSPGGMTSLESWFSLWRPSRKQFIRRT